MRRKYFSNSKSTPYKIIKSSTYHKLNIPKILSKGFKKYT